MTLLQNNKHSGLRALIFSSCIPANDGWETETVRDFDFNLSEAADNDDVAAPSSNPRRMIRQAHGAFGSIAVL